MASISMCRRNSVRPITVAGRIVACLVVLFLGADPLAAQAGTDAAATAAVTTDTVVPVAARIIPRGVVLVAEDIAAASRTANRLGWISRRVIHAGESLTEPAVVQPPVIRAGETVQYVVECRGIQLAITGTALSDASMGETLLVRVDAKRRVRAIVAGPGRVVARDGSRQR